MFIHAMVSSSDITEKVFSFYLTGLNSESYVDFGTPDTSVMNGPVTYLPIESENKFWASSISGFRWENKTDTVEYALKQAPKALTDTGTSCIFGPSSEINSIRYTILNMISNVYSDLVWDYIFDCSLA